MIVIFDSVVKNIDEHLTYSVFVRLHRRGQLGGVVYYFYALFYCALSECEHRLIKFGKNIYLLELEIHTVALNL